MGDSREGSGEPGTFTLSIFVGEVGERGVPVALALAVVGGDATGAVALAGIIPEPGVLDSGGNFISGDGIPAPDTGLILSGGRADAGAPVPVPFFGVVFPHSFAPLTVGAAGRGSLGGVGLLPFGERSEFPEVKLPSVVDGGAVLPAEAPPANGLGFPDAKGAGAGFGTTGEGDVPSPDFSGLTFGVSAGGG